MIKQLAVIPVSVVDRRSDLFSSRQDLSKNTRSFADYLKVKSTTCSYFCICSKDGCNQVVNFTYIIVKDVLVTELADDDICKIVLGWGSLDKKDINETVGFIEMKKMARVAMTQPVINASVSSSYRSTKNKTMKNPNREINCSMCDKSTDKFVWNKKMNKFVECL